MESDNDTYTGDEEDFLSLHLYTYCGKDVGGVDMFMRAFLYAENNNDAMYVYEDCVKHIVNYIVERDGLKVKPYWKFSDMYVIEESFKLNIDKDCSYVKI